MGRSRQGHEKPRGWPESLHFLILHTGLYHGTLRLTFAATSDLGWLHILVNEHIAVPAILAHKFPVLQTHKVICVLTYLDLGSLPHRLLCLRKLMCCLLAVDPLRKSIMIKISKARIKSRRQRWRRWWHRQLQCVSSTSGSHHVHRVASGVSVKSGYTECHTRALCTV